MTLRRSTLVLAGITLVVLVLSVPGALREALERGEIYLFSRAFLEDIPRRLTGPGRLRFILQPLTAIVLGIRSGLADARAGRPPYLYGVLFHPDLRRQLMTRTLETVVSASAFWNLFGFSVEHPNVPNNTVAASVGGRFTDRPTITYTPLMGERFARSMMTPVPPASVLSLIQAGYPVDLVLRLMVNVVNGLDNRHGGDLRARPAEAEFLELLERLRRVQLSGAIGMRVQRTDTKEVATLLTFCQKVDPAVAADALGIRRLLGDDPAASEFRVVYGAIAADAREIAMLTRSALEILINLSSFIDVPPAHVAEQRVSPMAEPDQGPSGPLRPLLQIKSSRERPADAFVMVPYRDYWFWIDDRDIPSKRMFSFIMFIFTLVEPGSKEAPPVLTIPTG